MGSHLHAFTQAGYDVFLLQLQLANDLLRSVDFDAFLFQVFVRIFVQLLVQFFVNIF